jgi:hypothetical protein
MGIGIRRKDMNEVLRELPAFCEKHDHQLGEIFIDRIYIAIIASCALPRQLPNCFGVL